MGVGSKAVVVLSYAHWEGFYNDCVRSYAGFLKERGGRMRDKDWMMLAGAFTASFQSLHDKHNSRDARRAFIEKMKSLVDEDYGCFSFDVVLARSNLDFEKLTGNYHILSFDLGPLQRHRLKIDREIVAWRHQIAHGDQPDLSAMDVAKHTDLVSNLLLIIADQFQAAILERMPN